MQENAVLLTVTDSGACFVPADTLVPAANTEPGHNDKTAALFPVVTAPSVTDHNIPIRKLELSTDGGLTFSPQKKQIVVTAKPLPENAAPAELIFKVTTDTGIDSNLATLKVSGNQAAITAEGDGMFCIRCMTKNNTDKIRILSQLVFTA